MQVWQKVRGWLPDVPPLVAAAAAVAVGCWLGTWLADWPAVRAWHLAVPVGGAIGLVAAWAAVHRIARHRAVPRCWCWLMLLLTITLASGSWGWCRARLFSSGDLAWSLRETPLPVAVEGRVLAGPRPRPEPRGPQRGGPAQETCEWLLEISAARHHDRWWPAGGRARVFVDAPPQPVLAGSRVRLFGRGLRPGAALNPGEFDFAKQARRSRVLSLIRVRDWSAVTVVEPPAWWSPAAAVDRLRLVAAAQLRQVLPTARQPLVAAVLLGSREELPRKLVDQFAATGTIHILAISGLHVGLLAATLLGLLRMVAVPRRLAWAATAIAITLYAAVVGGEVPVVRATLLIWAATLAVWFDRRAGGLRPLAAAAVLILLQAPAAAASVGPQLSFLATAVLLSAGPWLAGRRPADPLDRLIESSRPRWQRCLRRWAGRLGRLVLASLAVWLASAPLVAANFHRLAPAAVLVNLPVAPLISLVLSAGLLAVTLGAILPPVGWLAGVVCGQAAAAVKAVVTAAAAIPGLSLVTIGPPAWWLAGWYLLIAGLLLSGQELRLARPRLPSGGRLQASLRGWQPAAARRAQRLAVVACCWGLLGGVWNLLPPRAGGPTRLVCAAMGHGCGIVVRSASGRCLVYDAGRLGGPAAAGRSLSAVLLAEQLKRIDCLVISHADTDHFNGVPALLERFEVGQVVVPPAFLVSRSSTAQRLLAAFRRRRVPVKLRTAGDRIVLDQDCSARVLHPPPGPPPVAVTDNEQSLVLAIEAGGRRLLLTGDLEGEALQRFLAAGPPPCDFLLAPHHGSDGPLLGELVAATRTKIVLVSGRGGRDWQRVVTRCHAGCPRPPLVLRTAGSDEADRGAVAVELARRGLSVRRFSDGRWNMRAERLYH